MYYRLFGFSTYLYYSISSESKLTGVMMSVGITVAAIGLALQVASKDKLIIKQFENIEFFRNFLFTHSLNNLKNKLNKLGSIDVL